MSVFLFPSWWQICVPIFFLCLLVINICPVFLCINEKYIYGFQIVVGEALLQLSSHSLDVSWICCGHWFRSTSSWVSRFGFCYIFFRLCLLRLFSFCYVEMKMGLTLFWLCDLVWKSWIWFSELKIWVFSSGIVLLVAYLDLTWLILSWCCSKGQGA